jgi:MoaA/NifB/PqqE/SkfB family radical SAM enzyme
MIKNYFKIARAIVRYKFFQVRQPLFIGWELTDRCNYACTYCRTKDMLFPAGKELDTNDVLRIITDLASCGCVAIAFSGGECLLRDDIDAILAHAHALGLITKITTNGKLLPQKIAQLQLVDYLTISVDGSPETHVRLRGAGAFSAVNEAIDSALKYKKDVTLNMVLTKQSIPDIAFIADFARRKKVAVSFQPLEARAISFDMMRGCVPTKEEMKAAIVMIMQLKKTKGLRIKNPLYVLKEFQQWPDFSCSNCYAGTLHYRIKPDGTLTACSYQPDACKVNILHYHNIQDALKELRHDKLPQGCCAVYTRELNALLSCDLKAVFERLIS